MAVSYVAHKSAVTNFTLSPSTTWDAHNGGSLTNPCVLALVTTSADTTGDVTDAKFAGNAMTSLGSYNSGNNTYFSSEAYVLLGTGNIPTGTQTFSATCTGNSATIHAVIDLYSFEGVDSQSLTAIVASSATPTHASNTALSITVSSATGDMVYALGFYPQTRTITAGTGVTLRVHNDATGQYANFCVLAERAGAASTVVAATMSASDPWVLYGVSLTAATDGPRSGALARSLDVVAPNATASVIVTGALS